MAHNLDKNSKTGGNSYVGYKETPWHNLGTTLNQRLTSEDCLKLGGLDYEVILAPNIHRFADGTEFVSKHSFCTYRKDRTTDYECVLGHHVGGVYGVVQNIEALAVIDQLLEADPFLSIDTAGVLDFGRTAFVSLKRERPLSIGKNDEFFEYILLSNSFNGKTAITAMFTNIRVVSQSTLTLAMKKGSKPYTYSIKHTATSKARMTDALNILARGKEVTKMSLESFEKMYGTPMSHYELRQMCYNILLNDPEITRIIEGEDPEDVISTRTRNVIEGIFEFNECGVGQSGIKGTAWGGYNAFTGYMCNQRSYGSADTRMQNLTWGTTGGYNMQAFHFALNPQDMRPIKARFGKIGGLPKINNN